MDKENNNSIKNILPDHNEKDEKIVVKYIERPRKTSCIGQCRNLACLFYLIIILCCVVTVLLILARPAFLWKPFTEFLNSNSSGYVYSDGYLFTPEEVKNRLNAQITNLGVNPIEISEDELSVLVKDNVKGLSSPKIDVEPNSITLYFKLEESLQGSPILVEVELILNPDKTVSLGHIGTPKIAIPEFAKEFILKLIGSTLGIDLTKGNVLNLMIENTPVDLSKIQILKNKIVLNIDINTEIF